MRAARLVGFGDPPAFAIEDVPEPVPGEGQVVVDLKAAALNRRDPWIWLTPDYCSLPVTLGSDGAGVVSAVGPGVASVSIGDEVVINPTLNWAEDAPVPGKSFDILGAPTEGTFADKVVVPAANVACRPARLTWEESAALTLSGLTAWRAATTCARIQPGDSILVTGAGSGVSTFLIQIASALGARVLVTSSSQEKIERALSLGATAGFRYDDPSWPDAVCAVAGDGLDSIVDSYGGPSLRHGLGLLRRGGVFVVFGDTGGPDATIVLMDVYWEWRSIVGTSMGSPLEFRSLLAHVEQTSWRPVVDSVFSLESLDAAAARHKAPDRFGKVVLRIAES